jgi:small subunit ribosomal protein S12
MAGEFAARKLKRSRQKFRWAKSRYKYRAMRWAETRNPLAGAPQATAIVLEKRQIEQKQPHSGLIKCVRIRLLKNGKEVTAFVPKTKAIDCVAEHDQVTVEGLGGSQGGPVGSMWGVKWRVCKVNDVALEQIRRGKKQKPTR